MFLGNAQELVQVRQNFIQGILGLGIVLQGLHPRPQRRARPRPQPRQDCLSHFGWETAEEEGSFLLSGHRFHARSTILKNRGLIKKDNSASF